jgi:hypothetical protein
MPWPAEPRRHRRRGALAAAGAHGPVDGAGVEARPRG